LATLNAFCTWLAQTPLSQNIQTIEWIIPAVQTAHILCVAGVMVSVLLLNLRLMGRKAADQPFALLAARVVPVIWWSLPVLLATGVTLIIAEPGRALQNPVFLLKMVLLTAAILVTLLCQWPMRKDAAYWDQAFGRRWAGRFIAGISLALWIGIVCAGRWIAYVQVA